MMFASIVVDRGFEPQSGQPKDYAISMCCFSTKHISLRRTSKDWLSLVVSINEAPALTHNLN